MSAPTDVEVVLRTFLPPSGWRAFAPLGNHGGFSGASLWKVETADGQWCLRAWPAGVDANRVAGIHVYMAQARGRGLIFVPRVCAAPNGRTAVDHGGRAWDLCQWMPGTADFAVFPGLTRLQRACEALAHIHQAWAGERTSGPCPAVERRWQHWRRWHDAVQSGWRLTPHNARTPALAELVHQAAFTVPRWAEQVPAMLADAPGRAVIQPCLRDVWHDHLLFTGGDLTGLIDYGSVGPDHVAVDLARMLGSLVSNDTAQFDAGLRAYRAVCPLADGEEQLVRLLDRTGAILGATNWLLALCHEQRTWSDWDAVARRFGTVLRRLEAWPV
jgi:Ser/Thr protein kinase RdoA (MazF antagonist)